MQKLFIIIFLILFSCSVAWSEEATNSTNPITHDPVIQQEIDELIVYLAARERVNSRGNTTVWSIGLDSGCQYNTIQAAVDAADINTDYEFRVANNKVYYENIRIAHPSLIIKGGYDDCVDAQNNIENDQQVSLVGDSTTAPVLVLENTSEGAGIMFYYQLINFDVSGGIGNVNEPSGGINVLDNQIDLVTDNLLVHDNVGKLGGGIYIEGDQTDVILKNSLIVLNEADNGGGLYCDAASILMSGNSGLTLNEATGLSNMGFGGGGYFTNGCSFEMFSGTSGGFFDLRGIAANKANDSGGGIYADSGAKINLWGNFVFGEYGSTDQPINITSNTANGRELYGTGGGISATGTGTVINAFATIINENAVYGGTAPSGGAVDLSNDAKMTMSRLNFPCWNEYQCSQIKDNVADSNGAGFILYNGVDLSIKNTWISGHESKLAAFLFSHNSTVHMEGNVIVNNGGTDHENQNLMTINNLHPDGVTMSFNTFVNNDVDYLFKIDNDETFSLIASIIKESAATQVLRPVSWGFNPALIFEYLITHEHTSFSGSNVFVEDPLFEDEANENYRLSSDSPAINSCNVATCPSSSNDIDNQTRGWDFPDVGNAWGPYDLGADEFHPSATADIELDLELITAGPYYVGQTIELILTVTNLGPDTATDISLYLYLQNLINYSAQGTECVGLVCNLSSLNNGETSEIQITATINVLGEFFVDIGTITSSYDNDLSNNDALVEGVAVEQHADLEIVDNLSFVGPFHSGQNFNYQLSVVNHGPDTARMVWVDFFGENVELVSVDNSQCIDLPCEIASEIASQSTVTFDVTVQILSSGSFNWEFNTFSNAIDPDASNNLVTFQGDANSMGDLQVETNILTAGPYIENQQIEFEVSFQNLGPFGVTWSEISWDVINLENLVLEGDCSAAPCFPAPYLESGEGGSITITAKINSTGNFELKAHILSEYAYDPTLTNNHSVAGDVAGVDTDLIFADSFE